MFKYKNGRVCFGKISFVFPEGFIFNNDAEGTYFNGFSFLAPRGYNLEIQVTNIANNVYKDLERKCTAEGVICESGITSAKLGVLNGYEAYYKYVGDPEGEERCYAAHYKIPEGGQLIIFIYMDKYQTESNSNLTIQKIMKLKAVKDFLNNIRYEVKSRKGNE